MTLTAKNANCYAMNRATNMVVTDFIPIVLRPELRLSGTASEDRGYTYDAAWNLNYRTNNGVTTTVTVDGLNQLSRFGFGDCYYDPNGNLTNSHAGKRTYVYDDENRLTELYVDDAVGNPDKATEFLYDGLGRLRIRREYTYNPPSFVGGDDWELNSETRYVYDGMRVIQERNGSNTPLVSYTRGTDLSGSLEGAGGIGGLLARSHGYSSGTGNWSTHNFYHADGNGNITYLVNSSQTLAARYRYDPYGNTISSSGTLASGNVYRFSSKEVHTLTGLYYYGYRFYEPNLQRWLNQDPIAERYDANLYRFVYNSPLDYIDPDGLWGIQFGNFNIGWGNPNLAFDNESWSDLGQGAAAAADGFIPFWDPFSGYYDPCDPMFVRSKNLGAFCFNALTMAAGGAAFNAFGKSLAAAGGLDWAALSAAQKFMVSRASIPIFIANSSEVVGAPLAYFAATGVTAGGTGLAVNKMVNMGGQLGIGLGWIQLE